MNTSYLCFAGIDVCTDHLDLHLLPSKHAQRFPNTAAGRRVMIDLLKSKHTRLIVLESTGGYERPAVVAIVRAGLRVHVAQPQTVHAFAVSLKLRAKNDDIDAGVCARYAQDRCDELKVETVDKTHEALRALVSHRNDLVAARTQWKNRLKQAEFQGLDRRVVRSIRDEIAFHTKRIESIEKAIDATIHADKAAQAKADTLRKIKGVGPQTVRIVIALLPELGKENSRRLNSLVGVAPYAADSNDRKMRRHIAGGRMLVRNVLYMACMTAAYKNPVIKPYYEQMTARGVPHKSAMMACIRRLLSHMNEQIRLLPESRQTMGGGGVIAEPFRAGSPGFGGRRRGPQEETQQKRLFKHVCA